MPEKNKWSRRARSALAAWAVVSAMISPLIGGYQFLSRHGHFVPSAAAASGALTIVVNTCLLTFGVMWFGLLTGFYLAALSTRGDHLWETIAKAILGFFLSSIFLFSSGGDHNYALGAFFLVPAICLLSPVARWIDRYFLQTVVLAGTLAVLCLLFIPGWMQDYWSTFTGRPGFTIIPLSSMGYGWVGVALGAGIYVGAYAAFKQWQTEGRWLEEVLGRAEPVANTGAADPVAPAGRAKARARAGTTVTVYRRASFRAYFLKPSVYVDGKQILRLAPGRYYTLQLPPGRHTFESTYQAEPPIQADLKVGEGDYYEMEIVGGFPTDKGRLIKVEANEAIKAITQLLPLDAKWVKTRSATLPGPE